MRRQQSDLQVMETRIKKSLHRKGPSLQLGKTWVQLHETFNELNFSPICKQNDKTKSVPGDSGLTLKLHKTHGHLVHFACQHDRLFAGGGRKGKVAVQGRDDWGEACGAGRTEGGEEKASINAGPKGKDYTATVEN